MNYVVSSIWPSGGMCIYTYGSQIQEGTYENASDFLEYVERMSPDKQWDIYEVEFKKL